MEYEAEAYKKRKLGDVIKKLSGILIGFRNLTNKYLIMLTSETNKPDDRLILSQMMANRYCV